ncbi:anti-phage dCTP deaminase [Aquabacter cavernae]|uniref:anti-phage dCTP deaminase n=1 Tax=Aquabacter cavernae TaxID=2496029 RepID=UPI000F8D117C|nr:anti-phage dCTP deaminase [Aquabacter cavernae]
MNQPLQSTPAPELIFGIVAPIGVDLNLVSDLLAEALTEMQYETQLFRLTALMQDAFPERTVAKSPYIQSIKDRIAFANDVRAQAGDHALAALAISAIREFRAKRWKAKIQDAQQKQGMAQPPAGSDGERHDASNDDERNKAEPLPNQAYIIRQFKRPEEITVLRSIYGRQFILISATASEESRLRRIREEESRSCGGLVAEIELVDRANRLVAQDSKETLDTHGQNVRDAFPLGDVFIDASSTSECSDTIRRFIKLLFGNNEITPTRDEYGMYMAKSASLRSSDLSRQVGAAIFRPSGEVASLGCNEVPKAGGGTYWTKDTIDRRDFVDGYDPNERRKIELLVDVIDRLKESGHLSENLSEINNTYEICQNLLQDTSDRSVRKSKMMDILEFGRIIHAEMSAISDAARLGIPIKDSTLYCTTFPCHMCAKHIVAAGISRVVYLEPYPKSYAKDLHGDAIYTDSKPQINRVGFDGFIGVSPYRYRDLFEKGKRKYSTGEAQKWTGGAPKPMVEVYYPSYSIAERALLNQLKKKVEDTSAYFQHKRNDE